MAKVVALAMIAAPEPISTAVGLVVLGVLTPPELIIKYHEARKKKYLRHILKGYLNTYRPFGYGMGYVPKTSSSLPYRNLNETLGEKEGQYTAQKQPDYKPSFRIEEPPVIYHTLDQRIVARRYMENGGKKAGFVGYWGRQQIIDFKTPVQHSSRINSFSLS